MGVGLGEIVVILLVLSLIFDYKDLYNITNYIINLYIKTKSYVNSFIKKNYKVKEYIEDLEGKIQSSYSMEEFINIEEKKRKIDEKTKK